MIMAARCTAHIYLQISDVTETEGRLVCNTPGSHGSYNNTMIDNKTLIAVSLFS